MAPIHCDVIPLWSLGERTKDTIAATLCWPGRDFHRRLSRPLTAADGTIALVGDGNEIFGWARTEPWTDGDGVTHHTLEAFVREDRRRMGIAAFATAGLVVSVFSDEAMCCAVFAPSMLLVAARVGLHPTLFERGEDRAWRRAGE